MGSRTMSLSLSSREQYNSSKTYGINHNTKIGKNGNLNTKAGLTVSRHTDGPFVSLGAGLDSGNFKYTSKTWSAGYKAPSISVGGSATVGGGVSVKAKASFAEVNVSKTVNVFGAKVTVSGEVGIGAAVGVNGQVTSKNVSIGGKANVLPGVYVGANIDISF